MSQSHFKVSRPKTELVKFLSVVLHLFILMCVHLGPFHVVCVCERVEGRGGVPSWQESALSFCHVGLGESNPENRLSISPSTSISYTVFYPQVFQGSPGLRVIQVPLALTLLCSLLILCHEFLLNVSTSGHTVAMLVLGAVMVWSGKHSAFQSCPQSLLSFSSVLSLYFRFPFNSQQGRTF